MLLYNHNEKVSSRAFFHLFGLHSSILNGFSQTSCSGQNKFVAGKTWLQCDLTASLQNPLIVLDDKVYPGTYLTLALLEGDLQ